MNFHLTALLNPKDWTVHPSMHSALSHLTEVTESINVFSFGHYSARRRTSARGRSSSLFQPAGWERGLYKPLKCKLQINCKCNWQSSPFVAETETCRTPFCSPVTSKFCLKSLLLSPSWLPSVFASVCNSANGPTNFFQSQNQLRASV